MADDACSAVKDDLQGGTFTRYNNSIPIYILRQDTFLGGNVYIVIKDATREPVQLVNGPILYTKRGCTIDVVCPNPTIRDNIYLDITDILIATDRGYKIKPGTDKPINSNQTRNVIKVAMLL